MNTQIKTTNSDNKILGNGLKNYQIRDIVLECICSIFNTKVEFFLHRSRHHGLEYRQIFQYFLVKYTGYSLSEIGVISSIFGYRDYDHATVLHNKNVVHKFFEIEPKYKEKINRLTDAVEKGIKDFDITKQKTKKQELYDSVKKLISDFEDILIISLLVDEKESEVIDNKNICKKLLNEIQNETGN